MRTNVARVAPIGMDKYKSDPRIKNTVDRFGVFDPLPNLIAVLATSSEGLEKLAPWMLYLFKQQNVLDARSRELVSLRVGWLCRCGYQFAQHVRIGRHIGLDEDDFAAVKIGADDERWGARDRWLLTACDESLRAHVISNATWAGLREYFSPVEVMHVCYTIGQFVSICTMLNSFGVQLDPGLAEDAELAWPLGR